jgi:pimeloyl-ACP methyl ester carboxylesterase
MARQIDGGSSTHVCTDAAMKMIDVGGRRLAFSSSGTGSPTVVLETGLGAESSEWGFIQCSVAEFTRVCRYDRAGRGASDRAPRPRTASQMVDDLHALLCIANVPGPYVLVGHSFGGLLMRLYAHRYGSTVRGLLLVDSMHEDQFDVFGPIFPSPSPSDPPHWRQMRALWTGGWRDPQSTAEGIDFGSSLREGRAIESLGAIPMHVLTAASFLNQPLVPPEDRDGLQQRWDSLQKSFLKLSSAATQSFAPTSGHFVQRDAPQAVINAIKSLTEYARQQPCPNTYRGSEPRTADHPDPRRDLLEPDPETDTSR